MRKSILLLPLISLILSGCNSGVGATAWENTKSFGRYLNEKGRALIMPDDSESKAISSKDELIASADDDYIPLASSDLKAQYAEVSIPQPKENANLHIEKFKNPSQDLAAIFKMVHFNTDDHKLRVKQYFETLTRVTAHLKTHPELFVFVEGHCDDRASEAHNYALGTRRANYIRNQLISSGVSPDQVYTISYGKDRPMMKGTTRTARAKNRRVEFKIFDSRGENEN